MTGISATSSNQLSATGLTYDTSGNVLTDGVNTYAWNAESEMKTGTGVNYAYDGDGNRLQKSSGKIYWYGAGTEILDESDASGNITNEYVFFGGKRIAMRNISSGNIYYYAEDFLGSSRTMVQAGATSPCFDADFLPFGYEKDVSTTCTQNSYKFEGKERDTETGNDDFGARYYSSNLGRWESPDWSSIPAPVPYANLTNPQTLNLYAMVGDNPETFADLDGHCGGTLSNSPCPPSDQDVKNQPADNMRNSTMAQTQQNPSQNQHPVHEVALTNDKNPSQNGVSSEAEVGYGRIQGTSGGGHGFEVGAGGANVTINSDGGNTKGQTNLQYFTGDAKGNVDVSHRLKAELGGGARVFEGSGQLSTKIGGFTLTMKGTFDAVGVGANGHIEIGSRGVSLGGGVTPDYSEPL